MNEWVWSIGGMILTGVTEVLREKHYTASVVDEWMSMEHCWSDTDRGNRSTWGAKPVTVPLCPPEVLARDAIGPSQWKTTHWPSKPRGSAHITQLWGVWFGRQVPKGTGEILPVPVSPKTLPSHTKTLHTFLWNRTSQNQKFAIEEE
jgi:hypothetical protein